MKVLFRRYPIAASAPLVVLAWLVATERGWVGKSLLASPGEVAHAFERALHPATPAEALFRHAGATIVRALTGWLLSVVGGMALGLALGLARRDGASRRVGLTGRFESPATTWIRPRRCSPST